MQKAQLGSASASHHGLGPAGGKTHARPAGSAGLKGGPHSLHQQVERTRLGCMNALRQLGCGSASHHGLGLAGAGDHARHVGTTGHGGRRGVEHPPAVQNACVTPCCPCAPACGQGCIPAGLRLHGGCKAITACQMLSAGRCQEAGRAWGCWRTSPTLHRRSPPGSISNTSCSRIIMLMLRAHPEPGSPAALQSLALSNAWPHLGGAKVNAHGDGGDGLVLRQVPCLHHEVPRVAAHTPQSSACPAPCSMTHERESRTCR